MVTYAAARRETRSGEVSGMAEGNAGAVPGPQRGQVPGIVGLLAWPAACIGAESAWRSPVRRKSCARGQVPATPGEFGGNAGAVPGARRKSCARGVYAGSVPGEKRPRHVAPCRNSEFRLGWSLDPNGYAIGVPSPLCPCGEAPKSGRQPRALRLGRRRWVKVALEYSPRGRDLGCRGCGSPEKG